MSLVDVQPSIDERVEASRRRRPRSAACSSCGLGRGVGGEHREHRRHVRGEHRRALGHAADGDAAAAGPRPPCDGCRWCGSPRPRRRRRRRRRGGRPAPGCRAAIGVDRQRDADQAGRAHQHLVGGRSRARRRPRSHIVLGVGAGRGSPVAALALPLLRTTAAACPPLASRWRARRDDRRGGHHVGGEHARRPATGRPSAVATSDRSRSPLGP